MRKRNLSEFMCIEMLYDYKSEKLDALRSKAVEEGLQSSPKVRQELKKLDLGISYCEKLKNISISEPLEEFILDQPKAADKVFSKIKWQHLPQPVRWAFEAVLVAVAIALFVTQVPDLFKGEKVESDSMLVKKFDIKPPEDLTPSPVSEETKAAYKTPETVPMDLKPVDGTTPVEAKKPEPAPVIVASKEIPELLRPPITEPTPTPEPVKAEPVAKVAAVASAPAATPVPTPTTEAASPPVEVAKPAPKKGNAYVYRMTMYVDDVDKVTPEIVALISSLGGERAGEVELGWRRKSGSYFHFSIPQANSPAVQEGLKKYSSFNMVKSAHPRVMPEGVERYILWVEKKEKPEDPGKTEEAPSTGAVPGEETQGTSQENNEAN